MTANDLTKRILLAIPRHFPGARAARTNVGGAVPMNYVRIAVRLIIEGKIPEAIRILQRPMKFGIVGLPDISGFIPVNGHGILLGVEVKCGRDKQSKEQRIAQAVYDRGGCIYVVATDKPADPVAAVVEEIQRRVNELT